MKNKFIIVPILLLIACQIEPTDIAIVPINEKEIIGEFLYKAGNEKNPIILVLPGSGNGLMKKKEITGLVKEGYDVLSIAYFGKKNLPKRISKIPIEYIEGGITWIETHKNGKERKKILLGVSKGSELALLYGSKFKNIDGIICYSPSSMVFPDHVGVNEEVSLKSSWTYEGQEVDFAVLKRFEEQAGEIIYKNYIEPALEDSLRNKKAIIEVENINCPILLLSGKSDLVWPSYKMSEMIVKRIEKANKNIDIKSIGFEDAGHQFLWLNKGSPNKIATSQSMRLSGIKKHRFIFGGTNKGTKNAMLKSKEEVLRFIEKIKNTSTPNNGTINSRQ